MSEQRPPEPPAQRRLRPAALKLLLLLLVLVLVLVLVLGLAATVYAAALPLWSDSPRLALGRLWSWAGLQSGALCLLSYGLRWRLWMAHYGRHFGVRQGLRLYLAGYAFTPTPGNVGEAARGLMLARNPLGAGQTQFAPYFESVRLHAFMHDGVAFHVVEGAGFNYEAYRDGVLGVAFRKFYNIPAWLPMTGCPFCQRYCGQVRCAR